MRAKLRSGEVAGWNLVVEWVFFLVDRDGEVVHEDICVRQGNVIDFSPFRIAGGLLVGDRASSCLQLVLSGLVRLGCGGVVVGSARHRLVSVERLTSVRYATGQV